MAGALRVHEEILRRAITAHDGYVFKTVGDAFYTAFPAAQQALAAGGQVAPPARVAAPVHIDVLMALGLILA